MALACVPFMCIKERCELSSSMSLRYIQNIEFERVQQSQGPGQRWEEVACGTTEGLGTFSLKAGG